MEQYDRNFKVQQLMGGKPNAPSSAALSTKSGGPTSVTGPSSKRK
jgi:hypothetical protein